MRNVPGGLPYLTWYRWLPKLLVVEIAIWVTLRGLLSVTKNFKRVLLWQYMYFRNFSKIKWNLPKTDLPIKCRVYHCLFWCNSVVTFRGSNLQGPHPYLQLFFDNHSCHIYLGVPTGGSTWYVHLIFSSYTDQELQTSGPNSKEKWALI